MDENFENIIISNEMALKNFLHDESEKQNILSFKVDNILSLRPKIPNAIYDLHNLKKLIIHNCQLSFLSTEIKNLENLVLLDLDFNNLSRLPIDIVHLKNLKYLSLSSNNFTNVPFVFDIDENIIGTIFDSLIYLNLSNNKIWDGTEAFVNFKSLKFLNLKNNNLSKFCCLKDMKNLNVINLKKNLFSKLPPNILPDGLLEIKIDVEYEPLDVQLKYIKFNKINFGPSHSWKNFVSTKILSDYPLVLRYTRRGDELLNKSLRSKFNVLPNILEPLYFTLIGAQKLTVQYPLNSKMLIFRGLENTFAKNIIPGMILEDKGFSSFTFSLNTALFFSDKDNSHVLVLETSDNILGVYLDSRYKTSFFDENEFVLGPGCKFYIDNIEIMNGIKFYYCHVIDQISGNPHVYNLLSYFQRLILFMKNDQSHSRYILITDSITGLKIMITNIDTSESIIYDGTNRIFTLAYVINNYNKILENFENIYENRECFQFVKCFVGNESDTHFIIGNEAFKIEDLKNILLGDTRRYRVAKL